MDTIDWLVFACISLSDDVVVVAFVFDTLVTVRTFLHVLKDTVRKGWKRKSWGKENVALH